MKENNNTETPIANKIADNKSLNKLQFFEHIKIASLFIKIINFLIVKKNF